MAKDLTKSSPKDYLQDVEPFLGHFAANTLLIVIGKNCALQFALELHVLANNCLLEDEGKEDEVKPLDWRGIPKRTAWATIRDYCTKTVLRTYEYVVRKNFPARFTGKLIKDISKSAVRKSQRYQKFKAAKLTIKTGIRSCLLLQLATFTVEQLLLTTQYFRKPDEVSSKGYGQLSAKNAVRCIVAVFTSSLGAGVGTLFVPGLGTWIGGLGGDLIVLLI